MSFTTLSSSPARPLFAGVSGRYAHGERLTLGEVELAAGAAVRSHQHPHEQLTYVLTGKVEFVIAGETNVLTPGMCALIPPNAPHHCRALETSRVVDIFTPVREDYR